MDYFRHDINASEDDKMLDLLQKGGYEHLGYYWRFVEYLYSRGGKVAKCKLSGVAWSLRMDVDKLSAVICDYGLFEEDDEYIYSRRVVETLEEYEAVGKRMAEIGRSGGQASAQARAKRALEKNEANAQAEVNRTVNHTPSESLSGGQADAQQNKIKKNKIKKNKIENGIERFTPPLFEEVKEYACKRGREELARPFFDYYTEGNWIDATGKPVKNWKQKFVTWCNKTPPKEQKSERYGSFDVKDAFDKALTRSYK